MQNLEDDAMLVRFG